PSPPVPPAPSPPPAVPQPAPTLAQPKPPVKIIDVPLTPAGPAPVASPPPPASQASPLPSIPSPDQPNVLVGQVNDLTGSPLSGVTLEIVDSTTGIPARALRTNRLGQFQIAIPLPPGSYVINAEKEGLLFDPVSVTVANSVIPPIAITAKPAISSQLIPDPLALSP
ncbi:MAG: Vegetative cell wall protein gp1, partial [Candidatus Amesbacteria bacterium GW2011_GWA1_48_9]